MSDDTTTPETPRAADWRCPVCGYTGWSLRGGHYQRCTDKFCAAAPRRTPVPAPVAPATTGAPPEPTIVDRSRLEVQRDMDALCLEVDRLRAEVDALTRERDEAHAKGVAEGEDRYVERHGSCPHKRERARAESRARALAEALRGLRDLYPDDAGASEFLDREGMRFYRETGVWPTFKSEPLAMHHEHDEAERTARWHEWLAVERAKAHASALAALASHGAGEGGER